MKDIMQVAGEYIGTTEIRGARDNPKIVKMFAASGNSWVADDETPWCAAFVGAVLKECGIKGTMKLNARSYLKWGVPVKEDDVKAGDVVVLWRGNPQGWQGHVAFFVRFDRGSVVLLGGNQGDKVSIATYDKSRVLGYRRAPEAKKAPVKAVGIAALLAAIVAGLTKLFGG